MHYQRKKKSVVLSILKPLSFLLILYIAATIFVMGCPERLALSFFIYLESYNIGRIGMCLILLVLEIILSIACIIAFGKETKWNNKNLSLPVITVNGNYLIINNYKSEKKLDIQNIEKVIIMNNDTVLQIVMNNKETTIPEHLMDIRDSYQELSKFLPTKNSKIVFEDSLAKNNNESK